MEKKFFFGSFRLLDVGAHQFGHFEHRDLVFAAEDRFEGGIGIDVALVLFVLEIVLFDVVPEFFCDLAAGHGTRSDDYGEFCIGLNGFEEGGVCFAGSFCCCRHR